MNVKELYSYLDELFPGSLSCEWDNDGLMYAAELSKEVKRILVTLDVSETAVEYAAKNDFDVIISHHPLIFKPLKSIRADRNSKIVNIIKNDIAVMSFHTRLDAADGGVNDNFAELLELSNVMPFGPDGEMMGRVGDLCTEMSIDGFANKLKSALGCEKVLVASAGSPVKKVALLGGDGKDFVRSAILCGADTYVTGRMSYNIMVEAREMGINLVEAGHFYTEDHICERIRKIIADLSPDIYTEHFSSNDIKII